MKLVIVKKGSRVLWKARLMSTFGERASGLMFKRQAVPLVFEFERESVSANAIHSLFCPVFDAVFLDKRKRVVSVFREIGSFKLFITPSKPSLYLIELPPGESKKVRVGDKLEWRGAGE